MKQYSRQETFSRAAHHLLAQGRAARDEAEAACRYRSSDGLKCAVGCLIPDELYKPAMENRSIGMACLRVGSIDVDDGDKALLWALDASLGAGWRTDIRVLKGLQNLHDEIEPEHWLEELRALAVKWGVEMPSLPDPSGVG